MNFSRPTFQPKHKNLFEAVHDTIEKFFSASIIERLDELSHALKGTDEKKARDIQAIKEKIEEYGWGIATCKDGKWEIVITMGERGCADVTTNEDDSVSMPVIMFEVDSFIETNLLSALRTALQIRMMEGLLGPSGPVHYTEHMRNAAGLKMDLAADTERWLLGLYQGLYTGKRKKWMSIRPPGKKSSLTKYIGAICYHVERLHPICKDAKRIYRAANGGVSGRKAVLHEYHNLGEGERWAVRPEYVGFPEKLVERLGWKKPRLKNSPDWGGDARNIAIAWAALLCGFKLDHPGVRRIKEAIRDYKRNVGEAYYNGQFKKLGR